MPSDYEDVDNEYVSESMSYDSDFTQTETDDESIPTLNMSFQPSEFLLPQNNESPKLFRSKEPINNDNDSDDDEEIEVVVDM